MFNGDKMRFIHLFIRHAFVRKNRKKRNCFNALMDVNDIFFSFVNIALFLHFFIIILQKQVKKSIKKKCERDPHINI